jgi:undecaprenyl-diphosphatase
MAVVGAAVMTWVAPSLAPLWWAWSALLATSRVLLGMHYLGDVLAGAAFGALVAWLAALPLVRSAG